MHKEIVFPDYKNCIANIPNSVLKYFGAEPAGDSLPLLDNYLEDEYKNVIVMVLDGLGSSVLVWNRESDSFLRNHHVKSIDSVFPTATVAATTSLMTGLQPCEHAWLGWDVYYKDLDKNVTVYSNTIQGSKKQAADYHVASTLTPNKTVFDRLKEAGVASYLISPYVDPKPETLEEMLNMAKDLCAQPEKKYIYIYSPSPDDLLHKYGGANERTDRLEEYLEDVEQKLSEFTSDMKDTLLVVTADHGHHSTEMSQLEDHPELIDCLERMPSIEPRMISFFVKKGRKRDFTKQFNQIYGEHYDLWTKEQALRFKIFGTGNENEKFRDMLGDYLAIATGDVTIVAIKKVKWLSAHGGAYQSEMKVPVLIFKDPFFLGTDVDAYINAAFNKLKKRYPWAKKSMFDKRYSYAIEEVNGKKEFVYYYSWDGIEKSRYAKGWDGELFIEQIISDQEWTIQDANQVKEVFDVRTNEGVEIHGWYLERFEFRSHKLGGYSAFVQAGDRSTGGSRTFFFTPEQMSGTFEDFLNSNDELFSGHFGYGKEHMRNFEGLKEFLGFKE